MSDHSLRDAAALQGAKRYSNGKPCKRGHMSERWTSTGGCVECTTRRIIQPNAVRDIMNARIPIPATLPATLRVGVQNYITRCAQQYLAANGLTMPIHAQALDWADTNGKNWYECPY